MTSWYNPVLLVQTAIRVAISTIFGQFADKREAMAATNAIAQQPFDDSFSYRGRRGADGCFWLDYLADTGDGWDSTFAMARLLAAESLTPRGGTPLPRGQVLLLGGDQVYPSASRAAYGDRLLEPLEEAWRIAALDSCWPDPPPDLYALPGNHDWYDGLGSFFSLFCRRRIMAQHNLSVDTPGRRIAGWQTQQTRSYFALRLSRSWWLWGTDAQLGGYIDQPQLDFFRHVATSWMDEESKLILCVGDPAWAYATANAGDHRFSRFTYLEALADSVQRGHELKLILTGDSHHYARVEQGCRHYITCGGGGAFLHPTHQLKAKTLEAKAGAAEGDRSFMDARRFEIARCEDGSEALYPPRRASFATSLGNLAFPLLNPLFTLALFGIYLIFNWMLDVNSRLVHGLSLVELMVDTAPVGKGVAGAFQLYLGLLVVSPWTALIMLSGLVAYCYFADAPHQRWRRIAMGGAHWAIQTGVAIIVTYLVLDWAAGSGNGLSTVAATTTSTFDALLRENRNLAALLLATLASALVSAELFGLYLLLTLTLAGRHGNEAFSSLRVADFKCFLRLRIDEKETLRVHAIGLDDVPRTRRRRRGLPPPLRPHLIETVEIV
jgi:hypothetical protein